jgi:cell division protein FtsL
MATISIPLPRTQPRAPQRAIRRTAAGDALFTKSIDNSRLHREVDREQRRECYSLLALVAVAFSLCLLLAWQHLRCVRYDYQIEELKKQRASLEDWNARLRREQAELVDPQRIDTLARKELGLSSPAPQQVIHTGSVSSPAEESEELAHSLPPPSGVP